MSPRQALLRALVCEFLFSTVPSAVRTISLHAVPLGIARLGIASVVLTVWLAARGKLGPRVFRGWRRQQWVAMMLIGVAFGLHWLLYFKSVKLASAAIGVIGVSTYGVHLIVLGWVLRRDRPSLLDLAGLATACVGTLLLVPKFRIENDQTLGLVCGVLSGFCAAFLPLLHQRNAAMDDDVRTWGQFTFALPVFLVLAPGSDWSVDSRDVLLIAHIALVVTVVGHLLWVQAITALSMTAISLVAYLYLPGGLIVNYFTIGETLTGRMLLGAGLIFAANIVTLWSRARRGRLAAIHAVEE